MNAARNCDGCTLCCKLMGIKALEKPVGAWCEHCEAGSGCKIYERRPEKCRTFLCGYLANPELGEEWKPSRSKIVLSLSGDGKRVVVNVDPDRPDAWKREPYYSTLKAWARKSQSNGGEVFVAAGPRVFRIDPD